VALLLHVPVARWWWLSAIARPASPRRRHTGESAAHQQREHKALEVHRPHPLSVAFCELFSTWGEAGGGGGGGGAPLVVRHVVLVYQRLVDTQPPPAVLPGNIPLQSWSQPREAPQHQKDIES
jgi:hypothetical protein